MGYDAHKDTGDGGMALEERKRQLVNKRLVFLAPRWGRLGSYAMMLRYVATDEAAFLRVRNSNKRFIFYSTYPADVQPPLLELRAVKIQPTYFWAKANEAGELGISDGCHSLNGRLEGMLLDMNELLFDHFHPRSAN